MTTTILLPALARRAIEDAEADLYTLWGVGPRVMTTLLSIDRSIQN